jgi:CheY-like chemotaxis protein
MNGFKVEAAGKGQVALNKLKGCVEPKLILTDINMPGVGGLELIGELLARGHARSGDSLVIAGYLGSGDGFAEALAKFGSLYADQTEKDWEALRRSRKAKAKP